MKPVQKIVDVRERKEIAPGFSLVKIRTPEIAAGAHPGQFLHIRCSDTRDPLLRRPISIHSVDEGRETVSILYQKKGRGTQRLDAMEQLDIMGPLGRGFDMPSSSRRPVVVGGGIGVAPLFFLLQELAKSGTGADVFIGAGTAEQVLAAGEIAGLGHRVQVATDDGSAGYHGPVTGICLPGIDRQTYVYACGPPALLQVLAEHMQRQNVPGQFSLEARMGCGVGACLACACKIRRGENDFHYSRVCVDGPVFDSGEVIWE